MEPSAACIAIVATHGWSTATHYVNDTVNYTEPLFVVVIMALASTRPIIRLAESCGAGRRAGLGGGTPGAWWLVILIDRAAAGLIHHGAGGNDHRRAAAGAQFYDLNPSPRLRYATLGLLFVNVSIGGTLTHFAAPRC